MNYKSFLQNKMKTTPKLGYSQNFIKNKKNTNIFGMNDLKKNRDITPFRKYKQIQKKKASNNIIKKPNAPIKNLKIEGDLINGSSFGLKRSKTPINNLAKKNITSKSPNKSNLNLNSLSLNNSIKFNNPNSKQIPKSNIKSKIGSKSTNSYYSPLNRNNKLNYKRSITPNNKMNFNKNNNYINNKKFKLNRSTTPIPKSRFTLKKSNSKTSFAKSSTFINKKNNLKSPILGYKSKNFASSNTFHNKNKAKNGLNIHYNNFFKSKNIFAINKNKPKVITINMNINQNFLSTSSKSNINNIDLNNNNKATPRTFPLIDQNNNTNNTNITDNNTNNIIVNNSISNNNFSILHKYNNISQIESNNSIIINGIHNNRDDKDNKDNKDKDNKDNKDNNINESNNNNNENTIKQIKKKILCMHEFSKTGYAGEDEKKVNQDNYFVFRNFMNNVDYIFMAVCDGHGAVGQEISNFLKENLPIDLNHALRNKNKNILIEDISDVITDIFIKENTKLISNEMINSMLSGSTCVSVIYTPIKLITANVGDSRIILGKYNKENNKWIGVDLTRDHKPSLPDEEKRIISKGGRIEPMKDEDNSFIGPPRVWLKDKDYPGLAMSRSFGDRVAHSVGVSEIPEIKEYIFSEEDKFFVVASDGLFEFISSQNIVEIIKVYYFNKDIVGCCEYLYELSRDKWMKEEEVVDDITMILVFLEDE